MEKNSLSLLDQIKSKYILQEVLCLAYEETKSVIKLVKYNKSLLKKLDINVKKNYEYKIKTETKIKKEPDICFIFLFFCELILFIIFLSYIIKFYANGKFNHKSLKDGYNVKKKIFVDFMDDYILLSYFGFIIVVIIFIIIIFCKKSFTFKKCAKRIIIVFIFVVDFTHYIAYIIKLAFSIKLIKKELFPTKCAFISLTCSFWEKEKEEKKSNIIWFYTFDIVIIIVLSLYILLYFLLLMSIGCVSDERNLHSGDLIEDDIITTYFINQFNGINIYDVQLPEGFDNLSDKEKNETIFKKENISKYKYIKNEKRIKLILNIMNDIRRNIYIPLLKPERGEYIPDFILNEKTKMYFYPNQNIYQLSPIFIYLNISKMNFKTTSMIKRSRTLYQMNF